MNILEVCQRACIRAKEPQIADLFANDDQAREYLGYAEEASNYIFSQHRWRRLATDYQFTTVLDGGNPKTDYDLPDDFDTMMVYYLYDLTRQLFLENSDDDSSLHMELVRNNTDSVRWRLIGDDILRFDTPIDPDRDLKYTYKSKNYVKNIDDTGETPVITFSQYYTKNTDEFLLDDELLILGILWQRSLMLEFNDLALREAKFNAKLAELINKDGGLRKRNVFNDLRGGRTSGMRYSRYPFDGGC